jgi:hypothetical protein
MACLWGLCINLGLSCIRILACFAWLLTMVFFKYQLNCYYFLSRNICGHFLFLFFSSFHPYLLTGKIIFPICLVGLQLALVALFIFFLLWLTHFLIPMSRDLCIIPLYAFTAEPAYLKGPSYAIYFDVSFIYVLLPYVLLPE